MMHAETINRGREKLTVKSHVSLEKARQDIAAFAWSAGWRDPKWWEFWRHGDSKFEHWLRPEDRISP